MDSYEGARYQVKTYIRMRQQDTQSTCQKQNINHIDHDMEREMKNVKRCMEEDTEQQKELVRYAARC